MKNEVLVEGMKCAGCASTVQEKFEAVKGVESVKVNLESKKVVVESKEKIEKDTFKSALVGTKYSVVD